MGKTIKTLVKVVLAVGVFSCFYLSFGSVARADEVSFAGFTNGCFGVACSPPSTNAPQSATLLGLTFTNSNFNGTTAGGFLAIGNAPGTPNVNNLGSFTLNGTPASYGGQPFSLRVTFTAPPGITVGGTSTFGANLTGTVSSDNNGGVFVDFNNTPTAFVFSFMNAQGQTVNGSFNFNVNDVSVIAGGTIGVSGNVTAAQQSAIPEPGSMMLLGTGLIGIATGLRRRQASVRKARELS